MNEIAIMFSLTGDKFMPGMYLRQSVALDKPGFT